MPSMYHSPLPSFHAATCWRGASCVFKYYGERWREQCTHAFHIVASLPCLTNSHKIDGLDLGSAFVRFREKHQIQNSTLISGFEIGGPSIGVSESILDYILINRRIGSTLTYSITILLAMNERKVQINERTQVYFG